MTSDITNPGTRLLDPISPPMPSDGLFKWGTVKSFLHSLVDCIAPQRRRQEKKKKKQKQEGSLLSSEDTATMVKKLVLSTG